jgi:hypothetical protein
MPSGCALILTSFTSITTSSSDCSGEGTKRTYQGLWRMSDVEGRADIALRVARSVARRRQLHWLRRCDPRYAPDALPRMDCAGRPPAGLGRPVPPLPRTTPARARWSTLAYVEKVRPQFLSLRQHFRSSAFSMGGMAANPSIKLGFSKSRTLLESAELGDLLPGDGIFLQSFVLRRFSIVLEK